MIDTFNSLGDVVDILKVVDMALASEDGAEPFSALAVVVDAAITRAAQARESAKLAMALCGHST